MFEVRNIAFTYRKKPVLRDVSFVVSPGEVVCVVGANGAGKTTLLKVLATLAAPDSGVVMVDGQNALAKPLRYRRQLGYLPERVALYEDMTVKEYLNYRAALKGEPVKRIRRRVDEACEMCRISDLLRAPIGSLSAGLKKRVARRRSSAEASRPPSRRFSRRTRQRHARSRRIGAFCRSRVLFGHRDGPRA